MKHEKLTEQIIGAFFAVHNELGYGFLEKVYENSLCIELERLGIGFIQQSPITVTYRGRVVGEYVADVVVEDLVIVEVKAVRAVLSSHKAQLLNYLKATRYEVGLLLNFGPSGTVVRKVMDHG
ncbi:MAG: GxxExxY protein [Candidatus Sulfomarinibacteraceae bacterium]